MRKSTFELSSSTSTLKKSLDSIWLDAAAGVISMTKRPGPTVPNTKPFSSESASKDMSKCSGLCLAAPRSERVPAGLAPNTNRFLFMWPKSARSLRARENLLGVLTTSKGSPRSSWWLTCHCICTLVGKEAGVSLVEGKAIRYGVYFTGAAITC